jgi:hypothetical protein
MKQGVFVSTLIFLLFDISRVVFNFVKYGLLDSGQQKNRLQAKICTHTHLHNLFLPAVFIVAYKDLFLWIVAKNSSNSVDWNAYKVFN